jgi:hypothetical protein
MTRIEAIAEMKKGNKIKHLFFLDNEWMTMRNGEIITEEGYKHFPYEFWSYRQLESWNDGYSFYVS